MNKFDATQAKAQFETFCREHDIRITYFRTRTDPCIKGISYYDIRYLSTHMEKRIEKRENTRIETFPITTKYRYAVAMHELGHYMTGHKFMKNKVEEEFAAWEWARKNMLVWDKDIEKFMEYNLNTYVIRARAYWYVYFFNKENPDKKELRIKGPRLTEYDYQLPGLFHRARRHFLYDGVGLWKQFFNDPLDNFVRTCAYHDAYRDLAAKLLEQK